jgi:hypothetical protein
MDFLRALSPHAERATPRTSAILPSRFAGTTPLHYVPVPPPVAAEPLDAESRPNAADAPARPAMASPERFEARAVEDGDRVPTRRQRDDVNPRVAVSPTPLADMAPRVERLAPPDDRRGLDVPRLRESPLSSPHLPDTRGRQIDRDAPPGQSRTAGPAFQTQRARTDSPRVTVAQAPNAVPAPLSSAAVATRAAQQTNHRPVIHVTIDRIDVRAPASPPAALPARRRTAAPRTSLSEYLRGGGSRSGGGR